MQRNRLSNTVLKLIIAPAILLFLCVLNSAFAGEEISDSWQQVRLYAPDPAGGSEKIVVKSEAVVFPDVPGGKLAFALSQEPGTFLRFNPLSRSNQARDISFARTIKANVYSKSAAVFSIRIAGQNGSMELGKLEHGGNGWQALEWHLEDFQERSALSAVTLIDFHVSAVSAHEGDVILSGLVAED